MQKFVKIKMEYEDTTRKIPATDVKIEHGRLRIYDGEKLVGDFSESDIHNWSLESD